MQANTKSSLRQRQSVALILLLTVLMMFGPAVASAAPSGADTVVYVVRPGDTLRGIAAAHGTTISAIVRANSLANPDVIYPGQRLLIPARDGSAAVPAPAPTSTKPAAAAGVYHIVQLGNTLDKIARSYGVTPAAIIAANGINNPDLIWVGQKLLIPGAAQSGGSSIPATAQPKPQPTKPASSGPTVHVVLPGDTLSKIAQRYRTSVAALIAENDLRSADVISVGQRLTIPTAGGAIATAGVKPTKFVVSISQQRCWLYAGETLIAKWVCSTGRRGSGTRPGTYRIQSKLPKAYGSTWNIWMPYWLGIYWAGASENGIHGLPWNAKSGVQVWTGNVGTPITYGCVMLDNVNAKMLYNMAWIGMPVIIKP